MRSLDVARELATKARDEVRRSRIVARVALKTHLAQSLRPRGYVAALAALRDGASNPALVYRIHAANRPDAPALFHGERVLTFGALWDRITRVASTLARRGVGRGDSVLLALKNRPEFVIAQNACALLGANAVTASYHASAAELTHLAQHSRAVIAIVESDVVPRARDAMGNAAAVVSAGDERVPGAVPFDELTFGPVDRGAISPSDDAAVVVYTSGTTGKPKGAVRKFPRDTLASTMSFIEATPMRAGDVHLVAAPLYHSTAYAFATMTHLLGGACVLLDHFTPADFVAALARHSVNSTAVVPTMLHRVMDYVDQGGHVPPLPALRAIFSGGAALTGSLAARVMDRFGDVLYNFYGATETGLVTLAAPDDLRRAPGTIGRAVPGVEIRLVDDDGQVVARGEKGELYAKSALLAAGYLRDEAATRAASLEGFFSVGDVAREDGEGRYFIEGRKRDMINTGGVKVYPIEIEEALEGHPDVAEAAVVGVPDPEWGERVRAFIVPRADHGAPDADALRAFLKERLAPAKVPRDFVVMHELPRNPTGKVLKANLR